MEENRSKSVRFSEEQTTKTTGRIHANMLRTPPRMRADTSQKKNEINRSLNKNDAALFPLVGSATEHYNLQLPNVLTRMIHSQDQAHAEKFIYELKRMEFTSDQLFAVNQLIKAAEAVAVAAALDKAAAEKSTAATHPEPPALTETRAEVEKLKSKIANIEKENSRLKLSREEREEELNEDTVEALLGKISVLIENAPGNDLVKSLKTKLSKDDLAKLSVLKIKDIRDVQSRDKETKTIQNAMKELEVMAVRVVQKIAKNYQAIPNQHKDSPTYAQAVSKNQQPSSRPPTKVRSFESVTLKCATTLSDSNETLKTRIKNCIPSTSNIRILNAKKSNDGKSLVLIVCPLGSETELLANADAWFSKLGISPSTKQHLAVIHGVKIQQVEPFVQVIRDLNEQGFAHSDIRWLSQRKLSTADKRYSSIVVTMANKALHQKLLESSEIYLDGQRHTICAFNYDRPKRADDTTAGSETKTITT